MRAIRERVNYREKFIHRFKKPLVSFECLLFNDDGVILNSRDI